MASIPPNSLSPQNRVDLSDYWRFINLWKIGTLILCREDTNLITYISPCVTFLKNWSWQAEWLPGRKISSLKESWKPSNVQQWLVVQVDPENSSWLLKRGESCGGLCLLLRPACNIWNKTFQVAVPNVSWLLCLSLCDYLYDSLSFSLFLIALRRFSMF